MSTTPRGRDRLRELLDAVLDDENERLADMADRAFASPFHFSRELQRQAGESPVALRRRVLLERAAWQLAHGTHTVAGAAEAAGYASADGFARAFARAFGHPPSATTSGSGHRLDAPNGIHFHPPVNLWVDAPGDGAIGSAAGRGRRAPRGAGGAGAMGGGAGTAGGGADPTATLVHHDVDDTRHLLALAATLPAATLHATPFGGELTILGWDGPEPSVARVLDRLVKSKQVWVASIRGQELPMLAAEPDVAALVARHEEIAAEWIAVVDDIRRRRAWGDRLVDALCDPPESFQLGGVVAHVLTFSAHRRQLVRHLLRTQGVAVDHGDPLEWLIERHTG